MNTKDDSGSTPETDAAAKSNDAGFRDPSERQVGSFGSRVEIPGINSDCKYYFPDRRTLEEAFAGNLTGNLETASRVLQVPLALRDTRLHADSSDHAAVERAMSFLRSLAKIQEYREGPLSQNEFDRILASCKNGTENELKDYFSERIHVGTKKKDILARTKNQLDYIRAMRSADLVFGLGPAGTGKTYLAMAMAVSELLQRNYSRIILTRPAVEAGENLGYLPGTLQDKIDPYLRPLHDALFDMLEAPEVESLRERGIIEVAPLAFMRGRTLNRSFIILDEAQNTTKEQMLMFLTRLGFRSRCIVCGDPSQTDLPERKESGLFRAIRALKGIDGIRFCNFTPDDVVRHPLVEKIVRAYEKEQKDGTAKSDDAGFRMDLEKDEVRKFEAAALCGNSRKVSDSGLSRAAERQVGSFGSAVQKDTEK